MRKLTSLACAVILSASVANAGSPTTRNRTLNIKGTSTSIMAPDPSVDGATGACNFSAWVDQCSGVNCLCDEVTVSSASGSMDKGTQSVMNMFITSDKDIDPCGMTGCGLVHGLEGSCHPIRGVLTDTVSSTGETKTINLMGMSCRVFDAITPQNPGGNKIGRTFTGAWAINDDIPPSPAASGWGLFSAFSSNSTGAMSVKISGLVTE